jgi:hypothetical protein
VKDFSFVAELAARSFAIELPGDLDAITIHPAIPGLHFPAENLQVGNSSLPQTLGTPAEFALASIAEMASRRAIPLTSRAALRPAGSSGLLPRSHLSSGAGDPPYPSLPGAPAAR